MSSIFERYTALYKKLKGAADQYEAAAAQLAGSSEKDLAAKQLRMEKLRAELEKIDEYSAKVESFRKIAEKNIKSKNLLTITPRELNFNRMREWATRINPFLDDDPYAQRIYVLAKCNEMMLSEKKASFEKSLRELESEDQEVDAALAEAVEKIQAQVTGEIRSVIDSKEFADFADDLNKQHGKYTDADKLQTVAQELPAEDMMAGIGGYALPFPVLGDAKYLVKAKLPDYFDTEAESILLPVELPLNKEGVLTVACMPGREKRLYRALQNYLLLQISLFPPGERKIILLDPLHYNRSTLGPLGELENTVVLDNIPDNGEAVSDSLRQIISSFSDIDDTIGISDSVLEFNATAKPEEKLPRTLLVLVGYPSAFPGDSGELIKRILLNYERYGVSVVAIDTQYSPRKEDNGTTGILPVEIAEGITKVRVMRGKTLISTNNGAEFYFRWYELRFQRLAEPFLKTIKDFSSRSAVVGSDYTKRVDLENVPAYVKGKKKISVPYGVDFKDQVHTLAFDNENFASYLMGASGSGKSTLLHTIITGIIRDYHPDDVELWLADFKMAEFSQYIDPMPPHVKYILLDESRELVYDLIDRLTEKMMERQRLFMSAQYRDYKKVENVPAEEKYLPVIFVILDEFSIMSQALAESDAYKLKLQNLLAKGRALGIKFIFSSQTFTTGVVGLTKTAKDQIQMRIAMKNSSEEINNTLELSSTTRTEQVKNWIDALPPHYALTKYREDDKMYVKRVNVMYFPGKGQDAYKPQRDLIDRLRKNMRAVNEKDYSASDTGTYVDKHPVVVDGNSFKDFNKKKLYNYVYAIKNSQEYNGDEVFAFLGSPRLMNPIREVPFSPESRQNALLICESAERNCGAAVITSFIESFRLQRKRAEVWAYERNKILRSLRDNIWEEYPITTEMEELCTAISKLKKQIMSGEAMNDRLIVLLGFENICADFELLSEAGIVPKQVNLGKTMENIQVGFVNENEPEDEIAKQIRNEFSQALASASNAGEDAEDEDEEMEFPLDINAAFAAIQAKIHLPEVTNAPVAEAPVQEKTAEEPGGEQNKPKRPAAQGTEQAEAPAAEAAGEDTPKIYNAIADLNYIVQQGPRRGVHFLLYINSFSDLKATHLRLELFRHRFSFRLSADDSRSVFNKPTASGLPEHICYYSDLIDSFSFRPYLHRGLSWDGWGVDECGKVIDPTEIVT